MDEHGEADVEQAVCPRCRQLLPVREAGRGGWPAKFCLDACRKADHRTATAARAARAALPRLRRYMDQSLDEVHKAVRRLHASGLSEDELLMKPEPYADVDYAMRSSLERLRAAVREHRDQLSTAVAHPAGAAPQDECEG